MTISVRVDPKTRSNYRYIESKCNKNRNYVGYAMDKTFNSENCSIPLRSEILLLLKNNVSIPLYFSGTASILPIVKKKGRGVVIETI